MKTLTLALTLLLMGISLTGCSRGRAAAQKQEPLTVEQWTVLPPASKYDVDTLERVKAGDPKFKNEDEWDQFARNVVVPARYADVSSGKLNK